MTNGNNNLPTAVAVAVAFTIASVSNHASNY